ncbi:alpha-2-macroglobulin family protein [Phocaeicola sp.]
MRIRFLSLIVLLIMSAFTPAQAQTYERLWKDVEQFKQKDLPKSALSEAMKIYDKAKAEQNVPQMMKAYLTAMQYRALLTPDSMQIDVEGLEKWAKEAVNVEDKAVLYSILAEMTMPDSLQKAFGYLQLSLKDKDRLVLLPVEKLRPMVKPGETSKRYFHDNLYNLLARRAIGMMSANRWKASSVANQTDRLPQEVGNFDRFMSYHFIPVSGCDFTVAIMQTYQSLLKTYDTPNDRDAWLLTGIDALDYLYRTFPGQFSNDICQQTLRSWIQQYPTAETGAEAYLSLAQFLRMQNNQLERLKVIREGIAKYPRYAGINQLKNIEKEILNGELALNVLPAYPGKMQDVRITYRNLNGFSLQLYKVNLPVTSAILQNRTKDFLSKYARLQKEEHFSLKKTSDYLSTDTVLRIQAPQPGIYYLRAIPDGKKGVSEGTLMYATSLQIIYRPLPNGEQELVVVDAVSGQPVPDAEVVTYKEKGGGYMPTQTFTADKEGTVRLDFLNDRSVFYNAHTSEDASMPISNMWKRTYFDPKVPKVQEVMNLFTDRSIYRPGQTVYVSGLAYEQQGDSTRVLADKKYTVTLYDANNNEVGKVDVKTNGFGSFSGQFALPSPCLTGFFRLEAGSASASFRVEEYKRPTFDVTFDPVKVEYQIGDSIRLTGVAKTFAGAPVQNAKVHYNIERSYSWLYRRMGARTANWEGDTTTDAEGKFTVPVHFEVDSDVPMVNRYYTYAIHADVTDGAGETQQGNLSLPLGVTSVILKVKGLPSEVVKEKAEELTFSAMNLLGEPVDTDVVYQVYKVDQSNPLMPKEGKCVLEATARSNKGFIPKGIYALPSGSYRLKIQAKDDRGRECKAMNDFVLFSLNDKRPPIPTDIWFYQDGTEFNGSSPASIYVGSSERDVYLLYDVFAGDKRVESKRIHFSDSIVSFHFPYRAEYGNGIMVSVAFVKDGKLYSRVAQVVKPQPEKKLQLKWTTFRDKLRPGQQEEWKLSVLHPDGRPADAELLAMMYDASLDKLYKHSLSFGLYFDRSVPSTYWNTWNAASTYLYVGFPLKMLSYPSLSYSELLIPALARQEVMIRGYANRQMLAAGSINAMSKSRASMEESAVADVVFESEDIRVQTQEAGMDDGALESLGDVQLRENFAETAFFYPQLRTNEKGEVSIAFVLPESLTQWKFMGLAHTKDVDYGQIEATATASKEFMLQPNMPRFVRVGDKAAIAASLINLSDKAVNGTVRMELFNPETEKVFYSRKQKFAVQAGETGNVNFTFEVGDKHTVLACRMIADGDTFSDGEQRYIPVLTDKQWITETVPLNVNGKGTYTFSLEGLFNNHSKTASGQKMTVEFTSNPAWYAVQALPVVANPLNDDALSWAAAYYANALAESIVKANPRIKQVFDTWKAQGGTKETFMSRLQKNEELKNILLAETPWLAEAANEAEQRRRIATLFDLNTMNSKLSLSVERLKELQTPEGAWSWYKGMEGSRYITTQITELLARLQTMTNADLNNNDVKAMYRKALGYLAEKAAEEYKSMKEAEKKGATHLRPSEQAVQYLYICALDGKTVADANVNRYFINKLSVASKELTIYGKALSAIILQQAGQTAKAKEFMQSLLEYSVVTDEMGRYFDTPKAQYSWFSYKIPTEVAAMEAVERITKDTEVIDQMKRWLLKQKQTQTWDTPIATVNAVYALMSTGTDLLANAGQVKIVVGKDVIETPTGDAIGYVKQTVDGNVMNIKKVTVEKESAGLGWGAVYAQYLESMDKIQKEGNALSVSRSLYKDGQPVSENTPLSVGDKVTIRLTVKADRDMDFVQIKDERAACMEPQAVLSGYRWGDGLGYYQATKDASTSFFVDQMRKGTYVIEYQVYITRSGEYQAGIATIQSAYAPEFGGHTEGLKVVVK